MKAAGESKLVTGIAFLGVVGISDQRISSDAGCAERGSGKLSDTILYITGQDPFHAAGSAIG